MIDNSTGCPYFDRSYDVKKINVGAARLGLGTLKRTCSTCVMQARALNEETATSNFEK